MYEPTALVTLIIIIATGIMTFKGFKTNRCLCASCSTMKPLPETRNMIASSPPGSYMQTGCISDSTCLVCIHLADSWSWCIHPQYYCLFISLPFWRKPAFPGLIPKYALPRYRSIWWRVRCDLRIHFFTARRQHLDLSIAHSYSILILRHFVSRHICLARLSLFAD